MPKFNTSLPTEHNAAWELLRTGQPAAFLKSDLVAALVERWSLPYLVLHALCMLCGLSTVACWHVPTVAKAACCQRQTLSTCAGGGVGAQRAAVDVLCSDERADAFLEHDADKNVYGSFYHIREPSTRHLSMGFGDFAGCSPAGRPRSCL